jgi:hypothetical protein
MILEFKQFVLIETQKVKLYDPANVKHLWGWISPKGEVLVPNGYSSVSHVDLAFAIINDPQFGKGLSFRNDPYIELLSKGWVRWIASGGVEPKLLIELGDRDKIAREFVARHIKDFPLVTIDVVGRSGMAKVKTWTGPSIDYASIGNAVLTNWETN